MPTQARPRGSASPTGVGLRALAVLLGVYWLGVGVQTIGWVTDSGPLVERFQGWLSIASPTIRWYLTTVCIPGTPIFARLIPIGALCAGLALIVGFWTRMAAIATLLVVLNAHFVAGTFRSSAFLHDPAGLPVLGGLLALAIGGSRLPFTVER